MLHKLHTQGVEPRMNSKILKKSYLACFLLSKSLTFLSSKTLDKRGFSVYTFYRLVYGLGFCRPERGYGPKKKLDKNSAFHYN